VLPITELSMSALRSIGWLLAVALVTANFPSRAQNAEPTPRGEACFYFNEFESWRAPDDRTILIRVGLSRFFRLDLSGRCGGITRASSHLVNRVQGVTRICRPVDWNLTVVDSVGFEQRCVVKAMTMLTPEEVASIPPKLKP
jgi:hypothetical protein